ncbi:uncharacterized protein LOC115882672 isoform X2 [Sitophilus oryzae]|uniref:Uncharacterized protein LOC115882672 isoform X2 n=1 Tax=Sitophilus oryzae TaxID=7048 RepID=A0A6J2XZA4_SITOR|nr:uncharacterized protein LOC115882672 isoform X2 [Sitophilus oryzae]
MNSLIRNVKSLNIPGIKYISNKVTPSLSSIEHASTSVPSRDSSSHFQRSKSLPPILHTFKSIDVPYKLKNPQDISPFRARISPGLTRPTFKVFSKRFFSWKAGKSKVKSKNTENRIDRKRGRGIIRDTSYNTPCIKPKDDKKNSKTMLLDDMLEKDKTQADNSRTIHLLRSISGPSTSVQEKLKPLHREMKSQANTIKDILNLNEEIKAKQVKDNITITHCKNKVTFHYLAPRSDCKQCESKNSKRVFDFYERNVPKLGKYSNQNKTRFFSSYCKPPETPNPEETQPVKKETIIVKDQNIMANKFDQNKSISLFNLIKYRTSLSNEFFATNRYKFEAKQRPDIYQFQEDKEKEMYDPYPLEMFNEDAVNWSLDTARSMEQKQSSSFLDSQFKDDYVMLKVPDAANNLEYECGSKKCPDCGTGEKTAPCKIKAPKKKKGKREIDEKCRKPVKRAPCKKDSPCDQDWGGSRLSGPANPEQTLLEGTTVKEYELGGCRNCNKGIRQYPSKKPKRNDPKRDRSRVNKPGKSKKNAGRRPDFQSLSSVTATNYFSGDILNQRNFVESGKNTNSDHQFLNICQTEKVESDEKKSLPKFFVHPKDDLNETIGNAFELPPKVEISEKSKEMLAKAIRKMIQPVIETEFMKYDEVKAAVERMEQNLESCIRTLSRALQTTAVSPLALTNHESEKQKAMKLKYPRRENSEPQIIERSLYPEIKDPFKSKWEHRDPRNISSIDIPSTEKRISYDEPENDNFTDHAFSEFLASQKPFREIRKVKSETQSNFRNLDSQSKISELIKTSQILCSGKDPCKKEDPCKKKEDPCKQKEDPCKKKEDPCKKKENDPYNCVKEKKSNNMAEDPCKKKEDPCKKKEDPCKKSCFTPIETCKVDPCNSPCKKEEPPCKPAMESVKYPSNQSADSYGNMTRFEVTCEKSKKMAERECCQPPVTCDESSSFKGAELKCGKSATMPKIRQPPMARSCEATDACKSLPMPENCPLKPDCNQGCPEGKPASCYQTACKIKKEPFEDTNARNTCKNEINVDHGMIGMKQLKKCDYTKNAPCASYNPIEKPETFIRITPEENEVKHEPSVKLRECPQPTEKEKRYCDDNASKKEEEEEKLARIQAVEEARKKELEMECSRKPVEFGQSLKNKWIPVKIENKNLSDSKTLSKTVDSKQKENQLKTVQECNSSSKSKSLVENCSNKISDLCMMIVRKHKGGKKAAPIVVTLSRSQPNLDSFSGHAASLLMCPGGSSHGSGGNGNKKDCSPFGFFKGSKKSNSKKKSSDGEKFLKINDDCKKNSGKEKKSNSNNSCATENKSKPNDSCKTNQVKSEPCIPCKHEDYSKKQVLKKTNNCAKEKDDPCKKKEDPCKKSDKASDKDPYNCVKDTKSKTKADGAGKEKEDPCKKKEDPCKNKNDASKKIEDPCKKKEDPCKKKEDSSKPKEDPCKKKEDPCKKKDDPCKKKEDSCKPKEDPCKKKEDPCKKKDDPCQKKEDSCKPKDDPCKKKEDPCKKKEDPCKKKEDSCKTKEDPCKKKEETSKKKDDPCKKKEDSGKPKDDPCKKKEDPCKKKEDPCKKKEDSCKKEGKKVEDPCKKSSSKRDCRSPMNKPIKKIICTTPKSKFRNKYPWNDPELANKQSKRQCDKAKEAKAAQEKKCAPKEQKSDPCMDKTQKACRTQQAILKKFNSMDNTKPGSSSKPKSVSCSPPDKNKQMECKKEDPCKKQEDPCKKKEDPCKKKEDPSKKGDDPCKSSSKPKKKCRSPTSNSDLRSKIQSPSVHCNMMENNQDEATEEMKMHAKFPGIFRGSSLVVLYSRLLEHTNMSLSQIINMSLRKISHSSGILHRSNKVGLKSDDDACKKSALDLFPNRKKVDSTLGIKEYCIMKNRKTKQESEKTDYKTRNDNSLGLKYTGPTWDKNYLEIEEECKKPEEPTILRNKEMKKCEAKTTKKASLESVKAKDKCQKSDPCLGKGSTLNSTPTKKETTKLRKEAEKKHSMNKCVGKTEKKTDPCKKSPSNDKTDKKCKESVKTAKSDPCLSKNLQYDIGISKKGAEACGTILRNKDMKKCETKTTKKASLDSVTAKDKCQKSDPCLGKGSTLNSTPTKKEATKLLKKAEKKHDSMNNCVGKTEKKTDPCKKSPSNDKNDKKCKESVKTSKSDPCLRKNLQYEMGISKKGAEVCEAILRNRAMKKCERTTKKASLESLAAKDKCQKSDPCLGKGSKSNSNDAGKDKVKKDDRCREVSDLLSKAHDKTACKESGAVKTTKMEGSCDEGVSKKESTKKCETRTTCKKSTTSISDKTNKKCDKMKPGDDEERCRKVAELLSRAHGKTDCKESEAVKTTKKKEACDEGINKKESTKTCETRTSCKKSTTSVSDKTNKKCDERKPGDDEERCRKVAELLSRAHGKTDCKESEAVKTAKKKELCDEGISKKESTKKCETRTICKKSITSVTDKMNKKCDEMKPVDNNDRCRKVGENESTKKCDTRTTCKMSTTSVSDKTNNKCDEMKPVDNEDRCRKVAERLSRAHAKTDCDKPEAVKTTKQKDCDEDKKESTKTCETRTTCKKSTTSISDQTNKKCDEMKTVDNKDRCRKVAEKESIKKCETRTTRKKSKTKLIRNDKTNKKCDEMKPVDFEDRCRKVTERLSKAHAKTDCNEPEAVKSIKKKESCDEGISKKESTKKCETRTTCKKSTTSVSDKTNKKCDEMKPVDNEDRCKKVAEKESAKKCETRISCKKSISNVSDKTNKKCDEMKPVDNEDKCRKVAERLSRAHAKTDCVKPEAVKTTNQKDCDEGKKESTKTCETRTTCKKSKTKLIRNDKTNKKCDEMKPVDNEDRCRKIAEKESTKKCETRTTCKMSITSVSDKTNKKCNEMKPVDNEDICRKVAESLSRAHAKPDCAEPEAVKTTQQKDCDKGKKEGTKTCETRTTCKKPPTTVSSKTNNKCNEMKPIEDERQDPNPCSMIAKYGEDIGKQAAEICKQRLESMKKCETKKASKAKSEDPCKKTTSNVEVQTADKCKQKELKDKANKSDTCLKKRPQYDIGISKKGAELCEAIRGNLEKKKCEKKPAKKVKSQSSCNKSMEKTVKKCSQTESVKDKCDKPDPCSKKKLEANKSMSKESPELCKSISKKQEMKKCEAKSTQNANIASGLSKKKSICKSSKRIYYKTKGYKKDSRKKEMKKCKDISKKKGKVECNKTKANKKDKCAEKKKDTEINCAKEGDGKVNKEDKCKEVAELLAKAHGKNDCKESDGKTTKNKADHVEGNKFEIFIKINKKDDKLELKGSNVSCKNKDNKKEQKLECNNKIKEKDSCKSVAETQHKSCKKSSKIVEKNKKSVLKAGNILFKNKNIKDQKPECNNKVKEKDSCKSVADSNKSSRKIVEKDDKCVLKACNDLCKNKNKKDQKPEYNNNVKEKNSCKSVAESSRKIVEKDDKCVLKACNDLCKNKNKKGLKPECNNKIKEKDSCKSVAKTSKSCENSSKIVEKDDTCVLKSCADACKNKDRAQKVKSSSSVKENNCVDSGKIIKKSKSCDIVTKNKTNIDLKPKCENKIKQNDSCKKLAETPAKSPQKALCKETSVKEKSIDDSCKNKDNKEHDSKVQDPERCKKFAELLAKAHSKTDALEKKNDCNESSVKTAKKEPVKCDIATESTTNIDLKPKCEKKIKENDSCKKLAETPTKSPQKTHCNETTVKEKSIDDSCKNKDNKEHDSKVQDPERCKKFAELIAKAHSKTDALEKKNDCNESSVKTAKKEPEKCDKLIKVEKVQCKSEVKEKSSSEKVAENLSKSAEKDECKQSSEKTTEKEPESVVENKCESKKGEESIKEEKIECKPKVIVQNSCEKLTEVLSKTISKDPCVESEVETSKNAVVKVCEQIIKQPKTEQKPECIKEVKKEEDPCQTIAEILSRCALKSQCVESISKSTKKEQNEVPEKKCGSSKKIIKEEIKKESRVTENKIESHPKISKTETICAKPGDGGQKPAEQSCGDVKTDKKELCPKFPFQRKMPEESNDCIDDCCAEPKKALPDQSIQKGLKSLTSMLPEDCEEEVRDMGLLKQCMKMTRNTKQPFVEPISDEDAEKALCSGDETVVCKVKKIGTGEKLVCGIDLSSDESGDKNDDCTDDADVERILKCSIVRDCNNKEKFICTEVIPEGKRKTEEVLDSCRPESTKNRKIKVTSKKLICRKTPSCEDGEEPGVVCKLLTVEEIKLPNKQNPVKQNKPTMNNSSKNIKSLKSYKDLLRRCRSKSSDRSKNEGKKRQPCIRKGDEQKNETKHKEESEDKEC